jgi:FAD/FMN-containing dehydrogenase
MELAPGAVDALRASLRGPLLVAGDPGYEDSRTIWNAMIDRKPALIARALGVADVIACVRFAREQRIAFTIKGGGHNIAGLAACEGGLMLDMGLMRGVVVDPKARTAWAQAGCLLGDVDRETQVHGLAAVLGFVSNTGIAGLTLGGGFGYLSRRHGWTSDTVRSMQVVTADGRVVRASADENADLFWGLCGGGGNFGVVVGFEYQLVPVGPEIIGGAIAWRGEEGPAALENFRSVMAEAPPDVAGATVIRLAPPAPWIAKEAHGKLAVMVVVCNTGPVAEAEKWAARLKSFGSPVGDVVQKRPYVTQQALLDATQPKGRRYYWKSEYLASLPSDAPERLFGHAKGLPSPHSGLIFFALGEGVGRQSADHSPAGNRDARWVLNVTSAWEKAEDDRVQKEYARAVWQDMRGFSTGGTYVNFLNEEEAGDRLRDAYGSHLERLATIKGTWDPDNLFRSNKNIQPRVAAR